MKKVNVAVLGCTGVVGRQMMQVLEEYKIPVDRFVPLASASSAGKTVVFNNKEYTVQEAKEDSFKGLDFVLGAVGNGMAKTFAPHIVKAGAVFIDNSSSFRMDSSVPLVVPEINAQDAFKHKGIISNPNCSTIITMVAVGAINAISPITQMFASTYQAVSGAGKAGLEELENQLADMANGKKIERNVFPHQIAMNVIPFIGSETDNFYTTEEMKMQNEGRKILHNRGLKVSCTCVRVPVMRSHSISVTFRTKEKVTVEQAEKAISKAPGCVLVKDFEGRNYPTPLDTSGQDLVWVGRIREDLTSNKGLTLWCCGDQVRKGAASNAVQILKLFL